MAVDGQKAGVGKQGEKPRGKGGAGRGEIGRQVEKARRRLGRASGRERWRGGLPKLALVTAAAGALRPWVWPLPETVALAQGPLRTIGLMAAVFAAGSVALVVAGRRRGPSALGAARALDGALGRAEVVASGYAFEGEGRDDAAALLAREHAREALSGARPEALFALPSLAPPLRKALGALGALGLGLALGSYHPSLRSALFSPPREDELAAAGALRDAAEGLAKQGGAPDGKPKASPGKDPDPASGEARMKRAAELARSAAQSAQRGERSAALSKLASLRAEGEQARRQARALASLVRSMKENLPAGAEGSPSPKSAPSLAEGLNLLSRQMRQAGAQSAPTAEEKRALERLERGASEAAKGAASGAEAKAFAEAMERARQALLDGDREKAAAALEEAARAASALEARAGREGVTAEQMAALLKAAGLLEGTLGAGTGGGAPGEKGGGEGEGGGLAAAPAGSGDKGASLRARLAALGLSRQGQGQGGPGPGGGHVEPPKTEGRKGLEPSGTVHARSAVGEGERAVKALAGLGRGAKNAPAYKEVFPSYDAAAEEGLADERIPAARRAAVRRYFEAIRPGDEGEKGDAEKGDGEGSAPGAEGSEKK